MLPNASASAVAQSKPGAAVEHLALGVEDAAERLVDREVGGNGGQQLAEPVELLVVDRGADVAAAEHRLVGPA